MVATHAGKRRAQQVLQGLGLERAWELYVERGSPRVIVGDLIRERGKAVDIVRYLVKHGRITSKQETYLRSLLPIVDNYDEVMAERRARSEAALPLPTDGQRHIISGVVLKETRKDHTGRFMGSSKLTILTDEGWKVVGTKPHNLGDIDYGDRVTIEAYIEPGREVAFGWFKHPRLPSKPDLRTEAEKKEAARQYRQAYKKRKEQERKKAEAEERRLTRERKKRETEDRQRTKERKKKEAEAERVSAEKCKKLAEQADAQFKAEQERVAALNRLTPEERDAQGAAWMSRNVSWG